MTKKDYDNIITIIQESFDLPVRDLSASAYKNHVEATILSKLFNIYQKEMHSEFL